MFAEAFKDSSYEVRNIVELGPASQDVHYTHAIEMFFREGGGAPPVWARANGVDSVVLGITFMEELLGVFVRADDPAKTMADLAGRRLALPVWPRLVFNFWRFAALKGLVSALTVHDVPVDAVKFVDIIEGWDPSERRNVGRHDLDVPARCEYRNQLDALLSGKVDAIFGKGPEAALLQREAEGRIRLLYDVRSAPGLAERVNNSMPRLLTTSRHLVEKHFDAVVAYIRTLIRAASWVRANPTEARSLIARECSIEDTEIETYLEADYQEKFLPRLGNDMIEALEIMKTFLYEHRFIYRDFPLEGWIDPRPLAQAYRLEGITAGAR
jgi:ABC-type nitrate/sulfonate/bicarbonate transport system substrate-binding protein